MSSRRKYQSGSGYRSKRSKRKSEFHWGYVAVPAVVGVAGVTTLAIVLSKNKSKPGKDGAQGETGSAGKAAMEKDTKDANNEATDLKNSDNPSDNEIYRRFKERVYHHRIFQQYVTKELALRFEFKDEDGTFQKDKAGEFVYANDKTGRDLAEANVYSMFRNGEKHVKTWYDEEKKEFVTDSQVAIPLNRHKNLYADSYADYKNGPTIGEKQDVIISAKCYVGIGKSAEMIRDYGKKVINGIADIFEEGMNASIETVDLYWTLIEA